MVAVTHNDLDAETHLAVLTAVADSMEESVMITEADPQGSNPRILYVNAAFTRLTGYGPADAVGATPKLLQGGLTDRLELNRLKAELPRSRHWRGCTYNYTKSGQPFLMEWEIVPIHGPDGVLRFYLTVQRRSGDAPARNPRRDASFRRWVRPARYARAS